MKTTELKKLKLNVTNIKSSLFSYGKQSKKIRSDRKSLFSKEESENKKNEKENKIESPMEKIKSIGSNIKKGLIAGPMSILDKIKEFLTIIVFGLLVNNLPKIIAGLQKFFGNNPWILKTIEWTIKTIGKGILGFIDLVDNFSKFAGGTYATISKTTQDIKKEIDGLGNLYNNSEKEIKDLITSWTSFFNPKPKPSAKSAQAYAKSKGKYYSNTTGKTYANYATALKNPQVRQGAQQQAAPPAKPKQKLASGGTISSSRSNAAGTSARPETRTSTVATSPFARPGGTAKGRKAIQSVNYFGAFNKNTKNSERNTKMSEENTNKFEDITERLKAVNKLKAKVKDDDKGTRGPGGGGPYQRPEDIPLIGGPGIEGLSSFIAGAETGGRYDAYSGDGGKGDPAMLSMTLTELSKNYNMAVGAHQFMPSTAIGLARKIGLDPNKVVFTGETQDRLNRFHLNSMGYGDFINGSLSDKDFGRRIAKQYRALPDPYTGKTYDDKYAGRNNATRTWNQFKQALVDSKKSKNVSLRTAPGADPNLTSQFSPVSGTSGTVKYNGQENAAVNIPYSPFKNKTGNPRITSTVGYRGSRGKTHRGLDIEADPGTPLYAYLPGTVTKSGEYSDGYGYSFEWKDSKGNLHFFGHLQSAPFLQVGEEVKQGKNVGKVGSTGESTGPHLHWEIRRSSDGQQYTDPVSWVKSFSLPKPTGPVEPTGGQQIIPNFSIPLDERIHFRLGGVDYHAYKTRIGFDFYRGGSFGGIGATKVTNPNEEKQVTEAFIKYMKSRKKPAVEPGTAAASLIVPTSKNVEIASGSSDSNQQTVIVNTRTQPFIRNQLVAVGVPFPVENSGSSDSTSSIFSEVRSLLS